MGSVCFWDRHEGEEAEEFGHEEHILFGTRQLAADYHEDLIEVLELHESARFLRVILRVWADLQESHCTQVYVEIYQVEWEGLLGPWMRGICWENLCKLR
jgi:hypothetical protein